MVKSSWNAQDENEMDKLAQNYASKSEQAMSTSEVKKQLVTEKIKNKVNLQIKSQIHFGKMVTKK